MCLDNWWNCHCFRSRIQRLWYCFLDSEKGDHVVYKRKAYSIKGIEIWDYTMFFVCVFTWRVEFYFVLRIPYCYFDTELETRKSDLDNYFHSKLNKNSARSFSWFFKCISSIKCHSRLPEVLSIILQIIVDFRGYALQNMYHQIYRVFIWYKKYNDFIVLSFSYLFLHAKKCDKLELLIFFTLYSIKFVNP